MKKSKSSKGKKKKLQHKQRLSEIAKSQAVVAEANKVVDPMQHFAAFRKFDRNGLQLTVECKRASEMSHEDLNWAFRITKLNMQDIYDTGGWKWNDRKTRVELEHEMSWFLIARDSDTPVAFVMFRYELGDEDMEICYCYEAQIEKQYRSKGLGKFLLQLLELLCYRLEVEDVCARTGAHTHTHTQIMTVFLMHI
jgi:GNAT superfamily N-acetyltransferase